MVAMSINIARITKCGAGTQPAWIDVRASLKRKNGIHLPGYLLQVLPVATTQLDR